MARKKAPLPKELNREQTPAFLAALADLPPAAERDVLERLAGEAKELFNDAVRSGNPAQADLALLHWDTVVYRLNGDTFFGCGTDEGSKTHLLNLLAAEPGRVPGWGQDGEWLTEVGGLRIRVKARHWMGDTASLELFAVDLDQPYLSQTGYRAHYLDPRHWLGHEFVAAVRLEIERQLSHKDWKLKPIAVEDRARHDVPAWLAPALEGVTHNGQQALPLSGRAPAELSAPIEAEPKAPMSNADRQREFRRRQKELRENKGLRTISLTSTERCVLSLGLLAHEDLDHRGPNWVHDKKPGFDALLQKLWPEGDNGRYLAEPKRSTYRPAERLRREVEDLQVAKERAIEDYWRAQQELTALRKENAELKAGLQEIAAEFAAVPAPVKPAADAAALQAEIERLRTQLDKQHADNLNTIADLGKALTVTEAMQNRLKEAGLPHDYRKYLA